ncbi:MAG: IS200/IS605 family transposase [Bacilli bacterium]|nr:IS200/IS605 family transposase [Bacilli bacterium]
MDKRLEKTNFNKLTYGRGYVYSLQYHLVWCTKYRKKILVNDIRKDLIKMFNDLAEEYKFTIVALEVMPDHVHLLIDCTPQFYISDMVKILKGNTARKLFMIHHEIKAQLYGGHLWNPSYCAITVSDRSIDQVTEYINSQKVK